ncbi:LysR family transcriptional regulator [Rhodococcus sp. IEGM 248]|uniref:LysR family transcriptional regulator n=1 Tax=Rhodococcus opacus TaxID=37919 RepID=UPI0013C1FF5A|nr:LysR substrate-binding domain-containing protein [Rhodococcus opacus]MDV7089611.1 LysR substrate-binding domain-containing protein [Rhodococcus opacus]NDV07783.1 LysR family transcriptional regulator [Rhodococcus sp. IEGM 248]
MLHVQRLRLLCELHRRGTLAAVADVLSYSPSAVSQQLRQLEKEIGVPLIEPAGRGVRLTEQALILVQHGERILSLLEEAESDVTASLGEVRGTVRVAAFQTAALTLIPFAMEDLQQRYPLVRIEFTQGEPPTTMPGLVSSEFDLVIVESYPGYPERIPEGVDVDKLMTDPLWLVMSEKLASPLDADSDLIAQLSRANWAMELADSVPGMWVIDRCRRAGFEPSIICRSEDLLVHGHLVEAGLAVAVLPGLALAELGSGVARFPTGAGLAYREVLAASRSSTRNSPTIAAVRASLKRGADVLARSGVES